MEGMRWITLLLLAGCSFMSTHGSVDEMESADTVRDFRAPVQATWDAVRAELDSREIKIRRDKFDPEDGGEMVAAGGTVYVEQHHHHKDHTRVRIRISMFPDEDSRKKAASIMDGVDKRLEEMGLHKRTERS